jgi:hypothetical protein
MVSMGRLGQEALRSVAVVAVCVAAMGVAGPAAAVHAASPEPTTDANLNAARADQMAIRLASGKVLVAGGVGDDGVLASAELFDPSTDAWSAAASMATPRYLATAMLLGDGDVLVAGGFNSSSGYLDSAELYDPGERHVVAGGDDACGTSRRRCQRAHGRQGPVVRRRERCR